MNNAGLLMSWRSAEEVLAIQTDTLDCQLQQIESVGNAAHVAEEDRSRCC